MIARFAKVYGRVQRVGFRFTAKLMAKRCGVFGWVKNIDDGSVEIFVQGEPAAVEKLIKWAKHGPPWAKVEKIDVRDEVAGEDTAGFKILF